MPRLSAACRPPRPDPDLSRSRPLDDKRDERRRIHYARNSRRDSPVHGAEVPHVQVRYSRGYARLPCSFPPATRVQYSTCGS